MCIRDRSTGNSLKTAMVFGILPALLLVTLTLASAEVPNPVTGVVGMATIPPATTHVSGSHINYHHNWYNPSTRRTEWHHCAFRYQVPASKTGDFQNTAAVPPIKTVNAASPMSMGAGAERSEYWNTTEYVSSPFYPEPRRCVNATQSPVPCERCPQGCVFESDGQGGNTCGAVCEAVGAPTIATLPPGFGFGGAWHYEPVVRMVVFLSGGGNWTNHEGTKILGAGDIMLGDDLPRDEFDQFQGWEDPRKPGHLSCNVSPDVPAVVMFVPVNKPYGVNGRCWM
eukprot:TRINITY_DN11761_c0_g1_i1.p1 TRINITY_DN11761_c0_g1~~TRINITY_DN11761_c0_g1_i1.p1  ORF type:complete len:283 (+),score=23.12 TRINITY_DN11761_c0_g1_i1:105-953(+)